MKTVCEELREHLTKEEFANAGKYIDVNRLSEQSKGIDYDLKRLFLWTETEEGGDYWCDISIKIKKANETV